VERNDRPALSFFLSFLFPREGYVHIADRTEPGRRATGEHWAEEECRGWWLVIVSDGSQSSRYHTRRHTASYTLTSGPHLVESVPI